MPMLGPLKLKVQVFCDDEIALGPGKADVLEAIDRLGSISAAGRALGMSYRRTWMLVDVMNRCWASPLVETTSGGGRRKGARLTPLGHELLKAYRGLEAQLVEAAAGPLRGLEARLSPRPRVAHGEAPAAARAGADEGP
jgi:molybdate transport system regulatory protein